MEYRIVEYEDGKFGVEGCEPFYAPYSIFCRGKPVYRWLDMCGKRFNSLGAAKDFVKSLTIRKYYAV